MLQSPVQNGSDAVALEASAGLALACAYSSSDEYEAELIQMRRKAGAYGPRHARQPYVALALAAAVLLAVFLAS
jgi:hypothetical protein